MMARRFLLALLLVAALWPAACDDLDTGDDPLARTRPDRTEAEAVAPKPLVSHLALNVEREQIPVCERPFGLALSPDDKTAFVACAGSGQVLALETEFFDRRWLSKKLYERIYRIVADPIRPRLYAVAINGARLHVLNTADGDIVRSLAVGGNIADLALVPGRDRLIVTTTTPPQAVLIDLATLEIDGHVTFPTPPGHLAVRGDGGLAVASSGLWERLVHTAKPVEEPVYLFDPSRGGDSQDEMGLGGTQARRPLFVQGGQMLLVPERTSATVSAFNVDERRLIRTIQVGAAPEKLVATPNDRWAFSLDTRGSSITRIDLRRKQSAGHVVLTADPQEMVLAPDGTQLYAALGGRDGQPGRIAVIDVETVTVLDHIRVGRDPCALAVVAGGRKLMVSNFRSNTVSILE
jgi:DNA-binding beta-propeller fold protein YncE